MAINTPIRLRDELIYSVFVRNFSDKGNFQGVLENLDQIQALGTTTVWFLPIHPIGQAKRKGSLGSPYAIQDYRAVNPNYGTLEDFQILVDAIHRRGMKVIIDVVYNHTSPDSVLAQTHPEWFYKTPEGKMGNRVGDWSDIVDLDYGQADLWDYQIETLKFWADIVDGFRCDVASLVPLDFWLRARREVAEVNPDTLWLAESVHLSFVRDLRKAGVDAWSDGEVFQAFDMEYDYDIREKMDAYLRGEVSLASYIELLDRQEGSYPANYVKLRNLENHDNPRIAHWVPDPLARTNWTAFLYFQNGATLLYAGQEVSASHQPSLFDLDPVDWQGGPDIRPLLTQLRRLQKKLVPADGFFSYKCLEDGVVQVTIESPKRFVQAFFHLEGKAGVIQLDTKETSLLDWYSNETITLDQGRFKTSGQPLIFVLPKG